MNHLKKIMQLKKKGAIECLDMGQMHKFFETYMKYVALTYLRIQGGKYAIVQRAMHVQIQLLFSYASKVRNYIFHGNYYPFQKEEKRFIFDIYTSCIQEIEKIIAFRNEGRTILDNTDSDFVCQTTPYDQQNQLSNTLNFQPTERSLGLETARQILQSSHSNTAVKTI